jgi:hypothetical protein
VDKTPGRDRAIQKFVGRERDLLTAVDCDDLELLNQGDAFDRRAHCSEQQAVIPAGGGQSDRGRGKPADAVGDQPFTPGAFVEAAERIASQLDRRRKR